MSMNDLISDLLSRIRNGQRARLPEVRCQYSKLAAALCDVLVQEGYVAAYRQEEVAPGRAELAIELKYFEGEPVIKELSRVSKPGRRVYKAVDDLPRVHNGLGISVLSTSKGVMSDFDARQAGVGGEVLCNVF